MLLQIESISLQVHKKVCRICQYGVLMLCNSMPHLQGPQQPHKLPRPGGRAEQAQFEKHSG